MIDSTIVSGTYALKAYIQDGFTRQSSSIEDYISFFRRTVVSEATPLIITHDIDLLVENISSGNNDLSISVQDNNNVQRILIPSSTGTWNGKILLPKTYKLVITSSGAGASNGVMVNCKIVKIDLKVV